MSTQRQRDHLGSLMEWMVLNRSHIGYVKLRPMPHVSWYERDWDTLFRQQLHTAVDCSEFWTCMFKMAGLKDPNGNNFSGKGYTGDMLIELDQYTDPVHTKKGALVIFGDHTEMSSGAHVAGVYQGGISNPVLCNHGDSSGPHWAKFSEVRSAFKSYTFLDVSIL